MRHVALLVALLVAVPSAQAPSMRVSITEGERGAWVGPMSEPYITGGPWAAIPAQPLTPRSVLTAYAFRIRSWHEGSAARVLVLAVTRDAASNAEQDTQIATFLLKAGEAVEVTQTERYGAAHVVITASEAPAAVAAGERRNVNVRVTLF
jgi:hypothetical protein